MEDENKVLEKQNITLIKNDWNGQHFDYEVGTESSADGFELWYLKEKGAQYDICENVYYEDSGVIEALQMFIENHSGESITIVDWTHGDVSDQVDWDELAYVVLPSEEEQRQNDLLNHADALSDEERGR
jgi:hypothetical protein